MYPPVGVGQIRTSHRHDLQLAGGRIRVPRGTMLWVPHHSAPPGLQAIPAYNFNYGGKHACPSLVCCAPRPCFALASLPGVDTKRQVSAHCGLCSEPSQVDLCSLL